MVDDQLEPKVDGVAGHPLLGRVDKETGDTKAVLLEINTKAEL